MVAVNVIIAQVEVLCFIMTALHMVVTYVTKVGVAKPAMDLDTYIEQCKMTDICRHNR